ncbi:transcriptional antiterminator, partial [Lacticaseibacillus paracasei]
PSPTRADLGGLLADSRLSEEAWQFLTVSFAAKHKQLATRLDHDLLKTKLQAYFTALDTRHKTDCATHPEFLSLMYFHVFALIGRLQKHQSLSGLSLEPLARDYPIAFNSADQYATGPPLEYQ